MDAKEREGLINKLESINWDHKKALTELCIPESTYYSWKKSYEKNGIQGLKKSSNFAQKTERVGFEPTVPLQAHTLSRRTP